MLDDERKGAGEKNKTNKKNPTKGQEDRGGSFRNDS